jgi:hypothetical protein
MSAETEWVPDETCTVCKGSGIVTYATPHTPSEPCLCVQPRLSNRVTADTPAPLRERAGELSKPCPCSCHRTLTNRIACECEAWDAVRCARLAALAGCPCTLVEPCSDQCTCADPAMSGGCQRCAKYGSQEQRIAAATRLASLSAALEGIAERSSYPIDPRDAFEEAISRARASLPSGDAPR